MHTSTYTHINKRGFCTSRTVAMLYFTIVLQVIQGPTTRLAPPQQQVVPPLNINPSLQRSEFAQPRQQLTPPQRVVSRKSPPAVREKIKVVQPPPLYIKAPPPKVMVVDRPRYIPTPPKVIRCEKFTTNSAKQLHNKSWHTVAMFYQVKWYGLAHLMRFLPSYKKPTRHNILHKMRNSLQFW